jgi:hypothetical protein
LLNTMENPKTPSAKKDAKCFPWGTRRIVSSPSVDLKTLGLHLFAECHAAALGIYQLFAECLRPNTRRKLILSSVSPWHSGKIWIVFFPLPSNFIFGSHTVFGTPYSILIHFLVCLWYLIY